jgi:hypothetical protein
MGERQWKEGMIATDTYGRATSGTGRTLYFRVSGVPHRLSAHGTAAGLELGGKHTEARHFRLMLDCAQICQTTADFSVARLGGVRRSLRDVRSGVRSLRAQLRRNGDLDECLWAARRCAESCRSLMT